LLSTGIFKIDAHQQAHLQDLPQDLRQSISQKLAECRVVQHLPSTMSGLRTEDTVWRVLSHEDKHPSAKRLSRWAKDAGVTIPDQNAPQVLLVRRIRKGGAGAKAPTNLLHEGRTYWWAWELVSRNKLIGLRQPGKLHKVKGAKQIFENYGVQISPEPQVITFRQVHQRLVQSGKFPVLRKGHLIHVPKGIYQGTWKVSSIKDKKSGVAVDIGSADLVPSSGKGKRQKTNVRLKTLIKDGMTILRHPLTGVCQPGNSHQNPMIHPDFLHG
jgi:hypothetical protein